MLFSLVTIFFNVYGNANLQTVLQTADSLFENQKFTEAFEIYEKVYNEGLASEAMLLKMAFIQDGSENYENALFYLTQYYKTSADRSVISKIDEIAEEYSLSGYQSNDLDYLLLLLLKYRNGLVFLLLGLIVLLAFYTFVNYGKGETSVIGFSFQFFLVGVLLVLLNFPIREKGILTGNNILMRSGPSAAAEPMSFLSNGHKVDILEYKTLWTKI